MGGADFGRGLVIYLSTMSKLKLTDKIGKFRSMKSAILEKMANNAINQFKVENFDVQGFIDTSVLKWAPRKKKDKGRKILVKTGRLRQSITVLSRTSDSVTVGTVVPYAEFINNGTPKMPQRKFIGKSAKLEAKNKRVLNDALARL